MNLLTGEYFNLLDEKGRISMPARLREKLPGNLLHLTRGNGRCIWVFPPEEWERYSGRWMRSSTQTAEQRSKMLHKFIAPMQDMEIDRAGRLMIPPSLRDYAGLSRDCVVAGIGDTIEIWDAERYRANQEAIDGDFNSLMAETSAADFFG